MSLTIQLQHPSHYRDVHEIITNKLKHLLNIETLHLTKDSSYLEIQAQASRFNYKNEEIINRHLKALKIADALQQHQIPANLIFKSGSIFIETNCEEKIRAIETQYQDQYEVYVLLIVVDFIALLGSIGILLSQALPILGMIGIAASMLSFYLNINSLSKIEQQCDDFSLSEYLRPAQITPFDVLTTEPGASEIEPGETSTANFFSPSAPPFSTTSAAPEPGAP